MAKRPQPKDRADDRPGRSAHDDVVSDVPVGLAVPQGAPPAPAGPSQAAVALFQQGMEALQRHDYSGAAGRFRTLLEQHESEGALLERVRVFLARAEQELSRRPAVPSTLEERLTAATAALNNGDQDGAESLARAVLAQDPHQDLALYLLAVVEARRGLFDAALSYLGQAIAVSPEARAQARFDPDFEPLRDLEAFRELTDTNLTAAASLARRLRRGRSER